MCIDTLCILKWHKNKLGVGCKCEPLNHETGGQKKYSNNVAYKGVFSNNINGYMKKYYIK